MESRQKTDERFAKIICISGASTVIAVGTMPLWIVSGLLLLVSAIAAFVSLPNRIDKNSRILTVAPLVLTTIGTLLDLSFLVLASVGIIFGSIMYWLKVGLMRDFVIYSVIRLSFIPCVLFAIAQVIFR